jgi:hypothetical protein
MKGKPGHLRTMAVRILGRLNVLARCGCRENGGFQQRVLARDAGVKHDYRWRICVRLGEGEGHQVLRGDIFK